MRTLGVVLPASILIAAAIDVCAQPREMGALRLDQGENLKPVLAVSRDGTPMSGVRVYYSASGYLATTGPDGKTKPGYEDAFIGLAPDGRISFTREPQKLVFGAAGTVRLHVTDDHGAPLAGHEIFLGSTPETKPLRPYGYQWGAPNYPPELRSRLVGKTDAHGNVAFSKLPKGVGLKVITGFGPTFDDYVRRTYKDLGSWTMDVMAYQGAVMADRPAHVVLAHDCEISGRVTRFGSGTPIVAGKVTLGDIGYGNMLGNAGPELRETVTDDSGKFHFAGLPNCAFDVGIDGPQLRASHSCVVESKVNSGDWEVIWFFAPDGNWYGSEGAQVWLRHRVARCDFRLSAPAKIAVTLVNPENVPLKGWYLNTDGSGHEIGQETQVTLYVPHGRHTISLINDDKTRKLGSVDVAEGSTTNLRYTVPAGLK